MIDSSDNELALNNENGNEERNCVEGSCSGLNGGNNLKPGGTEKSHEISQPRLPVSELRLEPGAS